ncbi:MAG TPA: response regulator [Terriglobales bacterium]|nr:response regulator [Terriglobales bacterium]
MATRILVIDDDRGIADSLKTILESAGYDCAVTYNGADALRFAPTFCPNLVISDVIMPGMSGIELASRLQASDPSVRVLLLSGNAATEELLTDAGGHALLVLAKPYSPRELLRVVREVTT